MEDVLFVLTPDEGAPAAAQRSDVGDQREEDGSPLTVEEVVYHDVRVLDKLAPVKPEAGAETFQEIFGTVIFDEVVIVQLVEDQFEIGDLSVVQISDRAQALDQHPVVLLVLLNCY